MLITKDDFAKQRRAYLEGKITYEQYYCWIGDLIRITKEDIPVPLARVRESKDPHLNDIPLNLWLGQHPVIARKAKKLPWSVGATVCVLKAMARRFALATK